MGQCGLGGDKPERKKPGAVKAGLEGLKCNFVVAGGVHTVAVTSEGEVYTFGCNDEFALGRTCVATDKMDKDEAETWAAKAEGLDGVNVVTASAGDSHTFVLADNGTVYGAGCFRDNSGALAFSDSEIMAKKFTQVYPPVEREKGVAYPPAVAIASGSDHVILLAKDLATNKSMVFTYGTGEQGQLGRLSETKINRDSTHRGVPNVERSEEFLASVTKRKTTLPALQTLLKFHPVDDALWKKKNLVGVGACSYSSFVYDDAGKVYSWGLNNYAQLGHGPRKSKNSTTEFAPKVAKAFKQKIAQLAGGQHFTIALTDTGDVLTVGRGDTGQLGVLEEDGKPKSETDVPVTVTGFEGKVTKVSAGSAVSFAISDSGKAYAWGFGENLQLSTGIEEDSPTPTVVCGSQVDERKVRTISGGGQHTAVIASD